MNKYKVIQAVAGIGAGVLFILSMAAGAASADPIESGNEPRDVGASIESTDGPRDVGAKAESANGPRTVGAAIDDGSKPRPDVLIKFDKDGNPILTKPVK